MTSPKSRIGRIVSFTKFGGVSEGGFVVDQKADSRFDFRLEMFDMSLEGEFTV